jgi:nicotinamidase-related amidase
MKNIALLIVDVQNGLVDAKPFRYHEMIHIIQQLIREARKHHIDIMYVQHTETESGGLVANTQAWEIDASIAPQSEDFVFTKTANSAFRQTPLRSRLEERNIDTLIIVGMQTEYCIDATVKVAFEYGYRILIPEGGTTTFDSPLLSAAIINEHYQRYVYGGSLAEVRPLDDIISILQAA